MAFERNKYIRLERSGKYLVPIVNLAPAYSDEFADVCGLANELGGVCQEIGFFLVENHTISNDLLQSVEQQIYRFFDLPLGEKMKIHISKSPYHRGYFPMGEENALGNPTKDIKEGFDMALELPLTDPDVLAGKPFHGPNTWPAELPEFRIAIQALYEEWRRTCSRISSLFALSLGLSQDFFVDKTDKPLCQFRATKYPPQKHVEPEGPIGCGAHTDYGIVSIIWQINEPGLQLQNTDGDWVDAPRIPGTFVCPIGDMTQRWTNDTWRATVHRVINSSIATRYSAALFFDPNYDCEIAPLPAYVTPQRPARYVPTTMGEHVHRGFDGTFTYRATDTRHSSPQS